MSEEGTHPTLRPAAWAANDAKRLWIGVGLYCFAEVWAIAMSLGLWRVLGISFHYYSGLAMGSVIGFANPGLTWLTELRLSALRREPVINERGEIASHAPFRRALIYVVPPFIAALGGFDMILGEWRMVVLAVGVSLVMFSCIMYRIVRIWRDRNPVVES